MNEPILIFETDPCSGTPRLQTASGAAPIGTSKEMRHLEDQVRSRYEGLVRQGKGTIDFKGQKLEVRTKEGDTSRLPTLEFRRLASDEYRSPLNAVTTNSPPLSAPMSNEWFGSFLSQIDDFLRSETPGGALPAEQAMLQLVCTELKSLQKTTAPQELALLMFVSLLMTAEHLSRTHQTDIPHPYAYALSGVQRLMSKKAPQTPWGNLPAEPNRCPAPSWLGRIWKTLTGK